jgi:polyhydroxybutyrate depolymerase
MHGGAQRSYRLHVPSSYSGQPMALVLVLHGYTETAQLIQLQTGFDALSAPRDYVTVYPQGLSNSWNGGGTCCGSSATQNVDDAGFLRALIAALSAEYCVDARRVHVAGMSNGGFMAHRVACELADVVASVASCAGQLQRSPCSPSRHVPLIQMHGTSDAIVPYNGVWYPSTETTMRGWAMRNGCTATTPTRTSSTSAVDVDEWPCPADGRVVLHSVKGGSHTWFQPSTGNPGATRVFADFFDANPKP